VDVTGLSLAACVVPASTTENAATERLVDELIASGQAWRLEVVLVDRGTSVKAATALSGWHGVDVRRVGWQDKSSTLRPIAPAWRVEVAHGMLGWSRRLAESFENTPVSGTGWLQVACIATILSALRTI
jgi:putative transposase